MIIRKHLKTIICFVMNNEYAKMLIKLIFGFLSSAIAVFLFNIIVIVELNLYYFLKPVLPYIPLLCVMILIFAVTSFIYVSEIPALFARFVEWGKMRIQKLVSMDNTNISANKVEEINA